MIEHKLGQFVDQMQEPLQRLDCGRDRLRVRGCDGESEQTLDQFLNGYFVFNGRTSSILTYEEYESS
jgi:hypothetical protein